MYAIKLIVYISSNRDKHTLFASLLATESYLWLESAERAGIVNCCCPVAFLENEKIPDTVYALL